MKLRAHSHLEVCTCAKCPLRSRGLQKLEPFHTRLTDFLCFSSRGIYLHGTHTWHSYHVLWVLIKLTKPATSWETYHCLCTQNSHKQLEILHDVCKAFIRNLQISSMWLNFHIDGRLWSLDNKHSVAILQTPATPRSCAPWKSHTNAQ
jgi:hypothetical protein